MEEYNYYSSPHSTNSFYHSDNNYSTNNLKHELSNSDLNKLKEIEKEIKHFTRQSTISNNNNYNFSPVTKQYTDNIGSEEKKHTRSNLYI